MSRNYGVEIECINITERQALDVLTRAGVNVTSSGYHRADYSKWNVSPDASVSNGCEIISPILNGEAGLEQIKLVCQALSDAGATVNKTCGLHVHVDASGLTGPWVRSIYTRYAKFEGTIDTFMPMSRRDNNNSRYIRSLVPEMNYITENSNWFSNSIADVCAVASNRYQKVNLVSYSRTKTIEFRHHSGSVNGNKVTNWVKFVLAFVEASNPSLLAPAVNETEQSAQPRRGRPARANRVPQPVLDSSGAQVQASEWSLSNRNARKIYRHLFDNVGTWVSVNTLTQRFGVDIASLRTYISTIRSQLGVEIQNCRAFGYMLVSNNVVFPVSDRTPNSVTRRTQVSTPVSIDFPNDEWNRGIPADLVSFYTERAMELSANS